MPRLEESLRKQDPREVAVLVPEGDKLALGQVVPLDTPSRALMGVLIPDPDQTVIPSLREDSGLQRNAAQ